MSLYLLKHQIEDKTSRIEDLAAAITKQEKRLDKIDDEEDYAAYLAKIDYNHELLDRLSNETTRLVTVYKRRIEERRLKRLGAETRIKAERNASKAALNRLSAALEKGEKSIYKKTMNRKKGIPDLNIKGGRRRTIRRGCGCGY
jgi:predicted  nucleic acid-binding Zn-ribbon protein